MLVTAQGPTHACASAVIGRYAFAVYDEGGLIDVNVGDSPTMRIRLGLPGLVEDWLRGILWKKAKLCWRRSRRTLLGQGLRGMGYGSLFYINRSFFLRAAGHKSSPFRLIRKLISSWRNRLQLEEQQGIQISETLTSKGVFNITAHQNTEQKAVGVARQRGPHTCLSLDLKRLTQFRGEVNFSKKTNVCFYSSHNSSSAPDCDYADKVRWQHAVRF